MATIILCPSCEEPCGREYPATHTDPGFREGRGEDFVLADGRWCCSAFCKDVMNGKYDEGTENAQQ